jgi:hypothetical protein
MVAKAIRIQEGEMSNKQPKQGTPGRHYLQNYSLDSDIGCSSIFHTELKAWRISL